MAASRVSARLTSRSNILSLMTCTISNDGRDATEYTSMYPWMPIKCFEFSMLYSSCSSHRSAKVSHRPSPLVHAAPRLTAGSWEAYLPRCVDDFCRKVLALIPYVLRKRIFYRGVVAIDKVPIDELDRK